MSESPAQFTGAIPEKYDRHMGPVFFEPYARDFASRVHVPEGARVLELACGTGILTRHLRETLPATVRIVATDLNEAMIDHARDRLRPEGNIEWRQTDATSLPFADSSFDAVLCQFGLMFFPDKDAALREIRRVLCPRGTFVFNVWDEIAHNDLVRIADDVIRNTFPDDPPTFYATPFGFSDPERLHGLLERNGFADVNVQHVSLVATSESARHVATGLVEGTPAIHELYQRGIADTGAIVAAVAAAIVKECGDHPVRARMRALVVQAIRPA